MRSTNNDVNKIYRYKTWKELIINSISKLDSSVGYLSVYLNFKIKWPKNESAINVIN